MPVLIHEDIRTLLYLDVSSFTILNVKVICNNVGYCSYSGCSHIMWGSRKADFHNSVRAGEGAGKRKGARWRPLPLDYRG